MKIEMDERTERVIFGAFVTILAGIYMFMGNNGIAFTGAIGALLGIGGYVVGRKKE